MTALHCNAVQYCAWLCGASQCALLQWFESRRFGTYTKINCRRLRTLLRFGAASCGARSSCVPAVVVAAVAVGHGPGDRLLARAGGGGCHVLHCFCSMSFIARFRFTVQRGSHMLCAFFSICSSQIWAMSDVNYCSDASVMSVVFPTMFGSPVDMCRTALKWSPLSTASCQVRT